MGLRDGGRGDFAAPPSGSATVAVSLSFSLPVASSSLRSAPGRRSVAVAVDARPDGEGAGAIFGPRGTPFAVGDAVSSPPTTKGLKFSIVTLSAPRRTGPRASATVTAVAAPNPGGRGGGGAGTASGALATVVAPATFAAVTAQP